MLAKNSPYMIGILKKAWCTFLVKGIMKTATCPKMVISIFVGDERFLLTLSPHQFLEKLEFRDYKGLVIFLLDPQIKNMTIF